MGESAAGTASSMLNPAFGLAMMYAQTYENALEEYQEAAEKRGLDRSIEAAERYAHEQALLQTPFELVGDRLVGAAMKKAFKSIPRNVLREGPESFGKWIGTQAREMGESAVGETLITTPAQTIGEALLAEGSGVRDQTTWGEKGWMTLDAMSIALGQVGATTGPSTIIAGTSKAEKGDFAREVERPHGEITLGTPPPLPDGGAGDAVSGAGENGAETAGELTPAEGLEGQVPSETVATASEAGSNPEGSAQSEVPKLVFSKKANAAKPEEVGRMWLDVAQDEKTASLGPTPTAKDFPTIIKELSPKDFDKIIIEKTGEGSRSGYNFHTPDGGEIKLILDTEGAYHVDSSEAKSRGTVVYQAIYAWAHNNGFQIDEDTIMLEDGVYRRTSQMLSSALRFRDTSYMTVGPYSGLEGDWIRNDASAEATAHNIGLLAIKEAEIVRNRLSDLDGMRYDPESQAFYDGEYRIPDEEAQTYIRRRIGEVDPEFSRRVGDSTFRRALATIAAQENGSGRGKQLVGAAAGTPRSFGGIRYSKDAGEDTGVSQEGEAETGGESAGAPGEAGRRDEGRVGEGRTEEVRGWTGEVLRGWGSKLNVVVHDSAQGITDPGLRERVLAEGGKIEAFFDPADGRIHLLADQVGGRTDTERLIRHEGIHQVVAGPLKEEFRSLLQSVRGRIGDEKWKALTERYPDSSEDTRIEEYLAYLGQNNPKATAWQSFVYEFKQALRRYFGANVEFSEADILAFLTKANRRLERGEGLEKTKSGGDLRFSKDGERIEGIPDSKKIVTQEEFLALFRKNPNHPSALALKSWLKGGFRDIQDGKRPQEEARLNELLSRLPEYRSDKPLFRGVAFYNERERDRFIAGFRNGVWTNEKPFMSATKDLTAATGFAGKSAYPVFIQITGDFSARDVSRLSEMEPEFRWQKEVLFLKGSRFKVRKVMQLDINSKGCYSITLEEVR